MGKTLRLPAPSVLLAGLPFFPRERPAGQPASLPAGGSNGWKRRTGDVFISFPVGKFREYLSYVFIIGPTAVPGF